MKTQITKLIRINMLIIMFAIIPLTNTFSHTIDFGNVKLHEWQVNKGEKIKASFLMMKDGRVYLQTENSQTVNFPLSELSASDQEFVKEREQTIEKINEQRTVFHNQQQADVSSFDYRKLLLAAIFLITLLLITWKFSDKNKRLYIKYFSIAGVLSILYSFEVGHLRLMSSSTSPSFLDSAFAPFANDVNTSWDNTYFYVESQGIPSTHGMMTGITAWQQQVPIPQCYLGNNAWSIPLNPVIAPTPVPVSPAHFSRGAIAVAVNGIPIFNPYTNTGVDAYLDGQLDQWGGHCGRADDYHYHIAPMQLYNVIPNTSPVAFGLDGFAVYGNYEPDGSAVLPLDTNNGHFGTNGVYHYHGVSAAPYMIGNMVGVITEDTTHQIVPQAHATPVRPSLTPLSGAVITDCVPNGTNGYTVTYTLSGQTHQVSYSWTSSGVYTFNFIGPGGTTTSVYNGFIPCQLPTGIAESNASSNEIEIYPNPAHSAFSLKLSNTIQENDVENIKILSATGQYVYSKDNFQKKIFTDKFSKGIYYIIVKTRDAVITKKLVIE